MKRTITTFTKPSEAIDCFLKLLSSYQDIERDVPRAVLKDLHGGNPRFTDTEMAQAVLYGAHQVRLARVKKQAIIDVLVISKPWYDPYNDFEELYDAIKRLIDAYCGEVTIYDVALRIGRAIGIEPDIYVYEGSIKVKSTAKTVLKAGVKQSWRNKKTDFADWLQVLSAYKLETFLCIVKSVSHTSGGWVIELPDKLYQKICYPAELRKKLLRFGIIKK